MTEITINIDDYLTEDEKKAIAINEFTAACRQRASNDFERIITNSAYNAVWKAVDECFDGNSADMLKGKIVEIIKDMTAFNVFKKPDVWDNQGNDAYSVLLDLVKSNQSMINEKVIDAIHQLPNKEMRPLVVAALKETLRK